ncbi:nadph-dependent carbonyl reductase family protein [Perkinsela sp. CCAP 1560/4]|nr:nadph-dependent carbonyl reductase family protein [Perkinsela sp. CCAP 1560/4]|eukprot:KNH04785.1 nadph-dependent carbonyl reductase family protein [Perkinsela sp. CCAP 1560/4]
MTQVALVTGANKGIGYYIARNLAAKGFKVFIGCRDSTRAETARKKLMDEVPLSSIATIELDIGNEETIRRAALHMSESCTDGIDVLVNNAAMAYPHYSSEPFSKQADETIAINYFGTLKVCEHFIPILKKNSQGRIVNISSRMGSIHKVKDTEIRAHLLSPSLTIPKLNEIMEGFRSAAATGKHIAAGWPNSAYSVSKIGVTALSRILARENEEIKVVACCPGWCRTDMAGDSAPHSAEEGADTPTWLAVDPAVRSGKFYADRKETNF